MHRMRLGPSRFKILSQRVPDSKGFNVSTEKMPGGLHAIFSPFACRKTTIGASGLKTGLFIFRALKASYKPPDINGTFMGVGDRESFQGVFCLHLCGQMKETILSGISVSRKHCLKVCLFRMSDVSQSKRRFSGQQTALSQPGWRRRLSDFGAMCFGIMLGLDCSINLRMKKVCCREEWCSDFQPYNR